MALFLLLSLFLVMTRAMDIHTTDQDRQGTSRSDKCPPDFITFDELPSMCYGFVNNDDRPFTWYDARSVCAMNNARPIDFTSQEEDKIVTAYYKANMYDGDQRRFWMGANDLMKPGSWRWAGTGSTITYNKWGMGEPWMYRSFNCAYVSVEADKWYSAVCYLPTVHNVICKVEKKH